MEKQGSYQLKLIEKLSFVRYGGTDEELRAANIILDEIKSAGGEGEIWDFQIPACEVQKCSLKVTAPFEREVECVPYGLSGELPEGGAELKLYYAERGVKEDYLNVESLEGCAVMLNQFSYDAYKLLCEKHASAFIVISGKWFNSDATEDLVTRNLRPKYRELGMIPGFSIRASDANAIIKDGAEKVKLELRETETERTSRDVLAVIPGTSAPKESIVITAHYDSVLVGTGSWDNATGSANIMALYRHFLKNPPRRTLRFIWCGSEEQGLWGSKRYIEGHEDIVKNEIKMCFNFDMCGTAIGSNMIFVTGNDELKHLAEQYCHEVGWSAETRVMVHSSDSAPFADKGIPGLGLSRRTSASEIHTRNDLIGCLSEKEMASMERFSAGFIGRMANAAFLPVAVGMPDDMKKELDKYFLRDKDKDAEKPEEKPEKKA